MILFIRIYYRLIFYFVRLCYGLNFLFRKTLFPGPFCYRFVTFLKSHKRPGGPPIFLSKKVRRVLKGVGSYFCGRVEQKYPGVRGKKKIQFPIQLAATL